MNKKINWKYKWDNEDIKVDFVCTYFISIVPFVVGMFLLFNNALAGGIIMMTIFLYLQIIALNSSLLDRINKLLKKGVK